MREEFLSPFLLRILSIINTIMGTGGFASDLPWRRLGSL